VTLRHNGDVTQAVKAVCR